MSKMPLICIYSSLLGVCFVMMSVGDSSEQGKRMFVDFFRREITQPSYDFFNGHYKEVRSASDAVSLFRLDECEIRELTQCTITDVQKEVERIAALESSKRTFENTVRAYDIVHSYFMSMFMRVRILSMVHPNKNIRDAADKAIGEFERKMVDLFDSNISLYHAFKSYKEGNASSENLSNEQKYALEELFLKRYEREGAHLSFEDQKIIKHLKKEIQRCETEFESNISKDNRYIFASKEELEGVSDDILASLPKNEKGYYQVGVDYPTYTEVMRHCAVEETRKKLYREFQNRAYPHNNSVLENLIVLRDELAKKLGFSSYIHFQLDSNMAKNPTAVEEMWNSVEAALREKEQKEFETLIQVLPKDIRLSKNNHLAPWNYPYLEALYQKKNFNFDSRKIAEYFPMEKTIDALFTIYQEFFGLRFNLIQPTGTWDPSVQLIEVFNKEDNRLLGYVFLDLHPRPNKYTHACLHDCIKGVRHFDEATQKYIDIPSVSVVIANFPKSTKNKPALLRHGDVTTFFHEFGHAMHEVLGQTQLAFTSGTSTLLDFVEMPSQMLEGWMWDKDILKKVSSHYQTGGPLPDYLIDSLIAQQKFNSGYLMLRQMAYGKLSFEYFKDSARKNPTKIAHRILKSHHPHLTIDPENHFHVSFGHLGYYGGGYYSYMWAHILASDIFAQIKEKGLLNPQIGKKLSDTIFSQGGSRNPSEMVVAFLEREPSRDAFLKDLGIS